MKKQTKNNISKFLTVIFISEFGEENGSLTAMKIQEVITKLKIKRWNDGCFINFLQKMRTL